MDSSVRGRLLRLLERVRKFREKKVEVEPEAEEEKKPGEHRPRSLSQSPLFTATSILNRNCSNCHCSRVRVTSRFFYTK